MEIKAQRWLAIWYRCPRCGSQTANPRLTPTKKHRERTYECHNWQCSREHSHDMQVVERRYYTTFCIESGVSFTTVAGTLGQLGPFKICDIVHPNIRAFRKWVAVRQAEQAQQYQEYLEHWKQVEKEAAERRERQRKEVALLEEAETVAYRREHAVELAAEQVANAVWVESDVPTFSPEQDLDDEHPF